MKPLLLFVYNADSGLFNVFMDSAHKLFSPKTYSCSLCAITNTLTVPKNEWKDFLQNAPFRVEFLHKDEFIKSYDVNDNPFPMILLKEEQKIVLNADEINSCTDVKQLIQLITEKFVQEPDENYLAVLHSYFEKEGEQKITLPKTILEDELWTMLRIAPENIPAGKTRLMPGFLAQRLLHSEIAPVDAEISVQRLNDDDDVPRRIIQENGS